MAAALCLPFAAPVMALADSWTDLRYAIYMNQEAEVVKLLDSGVDINLQNEEGWTALHVAAEQGSLRMVNYLLARGADANLKTKTGRTAYDVAQGYDEVRAALKAKMAPADDPFASVVGAKAPAPAPTSPTRAAQGTTATKPAAVKPAPAKTAPAASPPAQSPKPAAAADDHCKVMWREARALCSIDDTSCNMSASIRYQSCQKKGTWY